MSSISSPIHSFIQVNPAAKSALTCEGDDLCLPVISLADIAFQIFASALDSLPPGATETDRNYIAIPCSSCGEFSEEEAAKIFNGEAPFENYPALRPASNKIVAASPYDWMTHLSVYLNSDLSGIFNDGDCFLFCIYEYIDYGMETAIQCVGTTNCFKKISNHCFSTQIFYINPLENNFGFQYDNNVTNPYNIIRLPMYLRDPQLPGEEKGYQKSDGTFKKLSERINEQWILETDWMSFDWHKKLRIALSHDVIQIQNFNKQKDQIAKNIYRSEDYEINWTEIYHGRAKATTKIFTHPLVASVNSNCI